MKHFSTFWKILLAITFYASNVDAQSFERVTDLTSLKAGDELLLVYEGAKGDTLALGPELPNGRNRLGQKVSISNGVIDNIGAAHTIRLVGEKENWSLYDILDGTYLAFDGTDALVSKTNILSDYCKWRIYVEDSNGKKITRIRNNGNQNYCLVRNASLNFLTFGCYKINSNNFSTSIFRKITPPMADVILTMGAVGYATLYYGDRALVVPEGVSAHTMRVENDQLVWSKTYAAGATIPQATGVVLNGQQGSYTFKISQDEGEADAANMLKGTDEAATTTGGDSYFFLSPDRTIRKTWASSGERTTAGRSPTEPTRPIWPCPRAPRPSGHAGMLSPRRRRVWTPFPPCPRPPHRVAHKPSSTCGASRSAAATKEL
jgi:hypothetical protein